MQDRKRWYAELANTFLLWVEEVPENPPWRGHVLRRPWMVPIETPDGFVQRPTQPWFDSFVARSERIAKEASVVTVANCFAEYKHRLGELTWREWGSSDEDWEERCKRFITEGWID